MKRTITRWVTVGCVAVGPVFLAGPVAGASADCGTAVTCAVQQVQDAVNNEVGQTEALIQQEQDAIEAAVQGRDVACALQGRFFASNGAFTGVIDCAAYDGQSPVPGTANYQHGTFQLGFGEMMPDSYLGTPFLDYFNGSLTTGRIPTRWR